MNERESYNRVLSNVTNLFISHGCKKEDAQNIALSLTLAEATGVSTHGLSMVLPHIKKIEAKEYNLNANNIIVKQTPAFTSVDCDNAIGMASAAKCMQLAIDKASETGLHVVFANHCNTYSAAFVYVWQAVQQAKIGFTMSNAPAQMPPVGGIEKLLGTNPLAYAIPAKEENSIIFDMATSVVAKSKINQANKNNEKIPEGWALDSHGNPTTEPIEAIKGLLLPMAGAKGYGLSMMIDLFAGLLSGASCLDSVGRFFNPTSSGMDVGQIFVAIDPEIIYGENFYSDVDTYIRKIHSSKPIEENVPVKLPGENKMVRYKESLENGILLPENFWKEFKEIE